MPDPPVDPKEEPKDTVDGTASGNDVVLPDFILKRNIFAQTPAPTPQFAPVVKKDVQRFVALFNFNFLGKKLSAGSFFARKGSPTGDLLTTTQTDPKTKVDKEVPRKFTAAGVGKTLAVRLIKAQEELYVLYAQSEIVDGKKPTEPGFDAWCGLLGETGAWQFRNGQHLTGAAIDIDALMNPYIATRTNGKFGGEKPTGAIPADKAKDVPTRVFQPAVEAYDRACDFLWGDGEKANVSIFRGQADDVMPGPNPDKPVQENPQFAAIRFMKVHLALKFYFGTVFTPEKGNVLPKADPADKTGKTMLPHDPKPFADFKTQILEFWNRKNDDNTTGPFQKGHPSWKGPGDVPSDALLQKKYDEIKADLELVKLVMVRGDLQYDAAGDKFFVVQSRDPGNGFLSFRPEIAQALCRSEGDLKGLRWGACMFGDGASGDMMHFDVGLGFEGDVVTQDSLGKDPIAPADVTDALFYVANTNAPPKPKK